MSTMNALRAKLITAAFTKRDRSKIKWLSPSMAEQLDVVLKAVSAEPKIYDRMSRCGEDAAGDNVFYCQVPLCPRCFMRRRGKETGVAIKTVFAGASNADMSFVTLLLPVTTKLSAKDLRSAKRRLSYVMSRRRAKTPTWDAMTVLGWFEMERTPDDALASLGRNTRLALNDLGWPTTQTGATVWRPHIHAVIHHPGLTPEDVRAGLREFYPGAYQVSVKPFSAGVTIENNIKESIRYALKFRIEEAEEGASTRLWWPPNDICSYGKFLCEDLAGFQSLRILIRSA